jgi:uncharacterized Rmd1/YagE family protein
MKQEINFEAYFVATEINIAKYCLEKFRTAWRKRWEEPLVLEFENSKAYIFSFGSIVFQNADRKVKDEVFKEFRRYFVERKEKQDYENFKLFVYDSKGEIEELLKKEIGRDFFFVTEDGGIVLKEKLNNDLLETVAFVVAQAVALDHIEEKVDDALDSVEETLKRFRTSFMILRGSKILNYLYEVSCIKNRILSDLMLLEKPERVWEEDYLAKVYSQVRDYFEISDSIRVIENKLSYISETSRYVLEILAERRAEFLEIIVILLITIEIVFQIIKI